MPPAFRQTTQTRRGNRSGHVDHDDLDGLPVRQWRQVWVTITPPPPPELARKNDIWGRELPHGMPKDSHLLPNHTQELLRVARSGKLYKRPAPAEEEEAEAEPAVPEKPEKKEEDASTKGFQIKIWKQVARNAEGSTISHLAKRRKGTVTLSSDLPAGAAPGPTVTKATVRRIDAAGNPYTQEVTLNEGQPVDGEIISTTVVAAPVPSISVDAPTTPARRRPPPPKRKPKGPGRGRRRKLPLPLNAHTSAANPTTARPIPGVQVDGTQGLKPDDNASKQHDVEMIDDEEGEDGDDGEDDGDEGDDDDEDGDGADGDTGSVSRADSETKPDEMELTPTPNQPAEGLGVAHPSSSQELPAANINLSAPLPPPLHVEGSPLKQVVSAQSPGSLDLNSPAQEDVPKASAMPDGVEQTHPPVETEPGFLPATDAGTPYEPSGDNDMLMADEDVGMDLDMDMQDDVAPIITEMPIDTAPLTTGNTSSVALADAQSPLPIPTVESGDPIPAELRAEDEEARQDKTTTEPSLESAEIGGAEIIPSSDLQAFENTTAETTLPAETAVQNAAEEEPQVDYSPAPATDGPSADGQPTPVLPGTAESQDEQSLPQTQEDSPAYSPDLFSGLEAALNQHAHVSSEPAPEKSEAAASQPEASHQSE
ncbi:hypothetical protein F5Y14DRAFT_455828 [Nemania sp. NC0429]|nr:hypothetical protein F5Y14DRAFT_455828 [Nemania sp. NC0429]